MPGTISTTLPSVSHDQHHETDAAKRKGGLLHSLSHPAMQLDYYYYYYYYY